MACHEIGQAIANFSSKVRRWITVLLEAMLRIDNPQDIFSFALWSHCGRHWFGLWIAALLRWLALPGDLDLSRPHFNIFCSYGADLTPFGLRKWRGRLGCFCGNRSFCIHCTCFWGIHKSTLGLVNPREQVTIFTDAIWCHLHLDQTCSNTFPRSTRCIVCWIPDHFAQRSPIGLPLQARRHWTCHRRHQLWISRCRRALGSLWPTTSASCGPSTWRLGGCGFWQFNEERCNEKLNTETYTWYIILYIIIKVVQ